MARIPFLDSTAEIDLSHYDLIEEFSAREAACLIAGIDPNMQDVTELYGSPEFARMRTIEDAMEYACNTAEDALRDAALDFDFVFSDSPRAELSPPWYGSRDLHGELIPMLPCLGHWKALWKINRDGDEKHVFLDTRIDREKFRRQDIVQWLQATQYKKARYFASNTESDKETAHQAEIDRLQARVDMTQLALDDAKAENQRLQSELKQARENQSVDDVPNDRDKLLRHIGALALMLAEKSGTFKIGSKPNALQIAEAVGSLLDGTPDINRRGLGSSNIRASISDGVALLLK